MWQLETRIPISRVQHLDLRRGPLERRAGLATLIVHTAGTRLSAVTVNGLDEADAETGQGLGVERVGAPAPDDVGDGVDEGRVVGVGGVPERPAADGEDDRPVPADEGGERPVAVPGEALAEEVGVGA